MIKIINRYILKETFLPLLLALSIFTFVLLSGNLLKLSDMILNKGVNFITVFEIFIYLIPYLLAYTLPMSVLAAILVSFGKFSQDNEITALRASGISLTIIIKPVLILAFIISCFSIFINDPLVAKSHYKMRMSLVNLGYENPEALVEPGKFIDIFNRYTFYIDEIEDKTLKQIIIYESQDNDTVRTITAKEGTLEIPKDTQNLILHLKNGIADEPDPNNAQKFYKMQFKSFPIILELDQTERVNNRKYKRLKEMVLTEIREEIKIMKAKGLSTQRLKTEFHRKIAFSFAAFIFVLLGVPLAIHTQRGDKSASVGMTIILAMSYYILLTLGKTLAESELVPPIIAMWSPNIIMGSIGIYLIYRVQKV